MPESDWLDHRLHAWLAARDEGVELSIDALCAPPHEPAHPDLRARLCDDLDRLRRTNQLIIETQVDPATQIPPAGLPKHIGHFRIDALLGTGGFGRVYRGWDQRLNRPVAIKIPRQERLCSAEDTIAYLREAQTVAKLRHPHIVQVYDVGTAEGAPFYLVLEFIDGGSLADRMQAGPLPYREAATIVAGIADALDLAHSHGCFHRDVKPSNILLDVAGKAYLADFGLVLHDADWGEGPEHVGTLAYMSPEQIQGDSHRVDGRSDIYSLGAVLYQLLCGRTPFRTDRGPAMLRDLIVRQEPQPPRQIRDFPQALEQICLRSIAKRQSERYSTARDLADDLRQFLETDRRTPAPQPAPTRVKATAPSIANTSRPKGASTMPSPKSQRRQVVLAMTDIVGSVDWKRRLGVPGYIEQIKEPHDRLIRELLATLDGAEIVDHSGDGFVIRLTGATDAVALSLTLLAALGQTRIDKRPIQLRVAIHQGEIMDTPGGDATAPRVVGLAVDVVGRLKDLAAPGQILLTRSIYDDARMYLRSHPPLPDGSVPPAIDWKRHGLRDVDGCDAMEIFEVGAVGVAPFVRPEGPKGKWLEPDHPPVSPDRTSASPAPVTEPPPAGNPNQPLAGKRFVLLYRRNAQPDESLLAALETGLRAHGAEVFIDRHMKIGVEWAKEIERSLREADAVVPLISETSRNSDMLEWELSIAHQEFERRPALQILPIRVQFDGKLPPAISAFLDRFQYYLWNAESDTPSLLQQIANSIVSPRPARKLLPPGGAMPPDTEQYIERPTDADFIDALERRDSIVLVYGARQMGKTSLVARGCQWAREHSLPVVNTDCQQFSSSDLETPEALYRAFAWNLAEDLGIDASLDDVWNRRMGANQNFTKFLKGPILDAAPNGLFWFLDEVDRLFFCPFRSEVFGLFRSFFSERSKAPQGPLSRLCIVIAYATEAQFFITDMNQSPFNVGTPIRLRDFTRMELGLLNERWNAPLKTPAQLDKFYGLLGGNPYLCSRGLHELSQQRMTLDELISRATSTDGPFGTHLRRVIASLAHEPAQLEIVQNFLKGRPCSSQEAFYKLRSAGIMTGESPKSMQPRCRLYREFLEEQLL